MSGMLFHWDMTITIDNTQQNLIRNKCALKEAMVLLGECPKEQKN